MNLIVFVRSINPEYDSRLNKFSSVLKEKGVDSGILFWNRLSSPVADNHQRGLFSFNWKGKVGERWKNAFGLLAWNIYIFFWLIKNKRKISVIHAIDFDCIIPSFIFSKFFGKKIIFDVYDKYTDAKSISGFFKFLIDGLEKFFIKFSDFTILVDDCRAEQHGVYLDDNILVIENVPSPVKIDCKKKDDSNKEITVLGYFGTLESKHRGLEDLASVVLERNNLKFIVAGYGELSGFFKELSYKHPSKIEFYGALNSNEGLLLMSSCDIYIGMYYKSNKNHFWAAPNKYFEHLMLGLPLLTTLGTPPGAKVSSYKTGWSIDEGSSNLKYFFSKIDKDEIEKYSQNSKLLWERKFLSYYDDVYSGLYFKIINKLISIN